mmetsp:Transcript_26789/g.57936  ORF Transcript_26789/g.57936 Transcript_26789/m.57936 type:complete len:94 (+) Transcript_26789:459-740(+)
MRLCISSFASGTRASMFLSIFTALPAEAFRVFTGAGGSPTWLLGANSSNFWMMTGKKEQLTQYEKQHVEWDHKIKEQLEYSEHGTENKTHTQN